MRILILGSYPVYAFSKQLGIDSKSSLRVTSWNKNLANGLSQINGVKVHFITSTKTIPYTQTVEQGNLKLTFFVSPPKMNMFTLFEYTRYHVQKIINEFQPDIVHGIGTEHIWPYIAVRSDYPHVVTVHGVMSEIVKKIPTSFFSRKRFFAWLEKKVLKKAQHLISINPYVEFVLGKYTNAKIYSVENPISEVFFNGKAKPEQSQDILYVGTIEPIKDQMTLLQSFKGIVMNGKLHKNVILIMVGSLNDVEYYDEINRYIKRENMSSNVEFKGFVFPEELAVLYKKSSMLVLSSIGETAPMCIAEAMCCGLPVVSTQVGGVEHMVTDGETGFIVEPRDPQILAQAIIKLLESPELRRKMGYRARNVAKKRFHPKIIAEKTAQVYRSILDNSG